MDPRLKLEYYKAHDWGEEWTNFCLRQCRDVYEEYKTIYVNEATTLHETQIIDNTSQEEEDQDELMAHMLGTNKDSENRAKEENRWAELQEYLDKGREMTKDLITCWRDRQAVYPILAHLARNYPAIPSM